MQQGYIKDLLEEKAVIVSVKIKRCELEDFTIIKTENNR